MGPEVPEDGTPEQLQESMATLEKEIESETRQQKGFTTIYATTENEFSC